MKKHTMKHGLSALCLVLALCMAFQSVTLAADVSADTSADTSVVSEEAETTESTDTNAADTNEEAEADASTSEEEEAEEETPAEEAESDPAEKSDPAEPVEADPAEEEAEAEAEEEADALVTAQAAVSTSTGWIQTTDEEGSTYWAFSYLENSTVTTSIQAVNEVLYIPSDIAVDTTTTFKAGYYYFNADGKLVADGATASVGAVEVLKVSSGSYLCDTSSTSSGKVVQVVTTQTTGTNGKVTVSSTASYYTGAYNKLYYSNGELYTGYYINPSTGVLYYMTDGTYVKYTGQFKTSATSTYGSTTYTGDGLWYYNGSKFTGYVRRTSSDYVWVVKSGKGGTKLTGTMSTSKYYLRTDTGTRSKGDGKYYKSGKVYSGVVGSYYYRKGVKQTSLRGWQTFDDNGNTSSKSSANTYYFTSSGKVYTSCWKNLKRNGTTYRFYFNSDGTLCKNLYKKSSAWKKKATKLVISRSTHTATLYAKYNGSYKIPTKSFVVSTSRSASNFKVGTYKLSQRKTWFTISGVRWWYKWATYISGSGSWIHSEQYYTKGNSKSLRISSYNDLGTNQSKQCIRMQVVNAKLIYDMRGYGSIKTVVLNKSSNKGPFGKMTITDNVDASGKLSGTKGYDPTDPLYT